MNRRKPHPIGVSLRYGASCLVLTALSAVPLVSLGQDSKIESGKKLFTETAQPPCALCHTLRDAQASGKVGPDLDELKPDAQRATTAIRKGVGLMPGYEDKLSEEQIQALVNYVSAVARNPR